MPKRRNDDESSNSGPTKRPRTIEARTAADRLSSLSNEVLLHILSFLPIPSLITCQLLSRRFHALAGDSELWKRQYFSKWVRPRARRLAIARRTSFPLSKTEYSPRVSTWLDHGHLDRSERITNWKRQYHLRHNWSKGICRVTRVEIPQPRRPPMLATLCAGFVFTADSQEGLRAWSAEEPVVCKAELCFLDFDPSSSPTALTATCGLETNSIEVVVGFDDGRLMVFKMDTTRLQLDMRFTSKSVQGAITAIASSYPYLMVVSELMVLSLYRLPLTIDSLSRLNDAVHLIASLKADNMLSPMSLSVRFAGSDIIASVVYSFYHLGCGWSLGIQELHFDRTGQQLSSRLTTTVDTQYGVVKFHLLGSKNGYSSAPSRSNTHSYATPLTPTILHPDPPTSISYSHPYLLTSHPDNTLTVYLVVSNLDHLFVKGGRRLWGHTSSVSAVQVSDRGKAVSVSSHGDEVRIWELETLISSFGTQRTFPGETSVKVETDRQNDSSEGGRSSLLSETRARSPFVDAPISLAQARGCVGFDDERLLLLRGRDHGAQLLEFYDFT
ncbi:hypothetical protein BJY01DRAFT_52041 [Aspergillus pseudoustus]|uniref:Probable E3 ubiquitin ligase complex SCF subunit sconB n=1 Tax=Aspergillus pseudoustus TaxID=1810923 RepID=A0ABR4J9U0_9EURO